MASIEDQITELWGEISAATHRFLTLIAEFDRAEGWMGAGMKSCAQWLNLHCGIGEVAAREKLRVAHALGKLPEINAAFRDGQVSYSKVRAMTRVATPANESTLLNIARYGTASHVERTVRLFRRVERLEETEIAADVHRQRSVHFRTDDDGSVVIHARVPAEVGALVRQAIERAAEMAEADRPVEPDEPDHSFDRFGRRRAEGLRVMAEQFLANASEASGAAGDRYQVVVHIDQSVLSESDITEMHTDCLEPGQCELEDGPALAVETARRLACDGSLVGLVEDAEGTPLNIGRKTRAIPPSIRRALQARDGGCRFPGCTHTRFTEGHHVEYWANGGQTELANLVTLCHFHHHLVHEGGFGVRVVAKRAADGARQRDFRFTRPDGTPLAESIPVQKCFRGNKLPETNREHGIVIDPSTIDSRWLGERMDYSLAIDALIAARDRPGAQSAVN
jgi:hypothetical protein